MTKIPDLPADVFFGSADNDQLPDWRAGPHELHDDDDPDDEELESTPDDVIAMLGFDPLDDDDSDDNDEKRNTRAGLESIQAVAGIVRSELRRAMRREASTVRRAAGKPGFAAAIDGLCDEQETYLIETLSPSLNAYAVLTGQPVDCRKLAAEWTAETRSQLTELEAVTTSDQRPAAIESLIKGWDAHRSSSFFERRIVTDTEQRSVDGEEVHRFSSTQINLPSDLAAKVLALAKTIDVSDLAADGYETEPHITVLYGTETDDPADVERVLTAERPISITIGKTSVFPAKETGPQRGGDQYDVVKLDVSGDGLYQLNKLLADALPHTSTHPNYQPHITLAYVKPGIGAKYAGASELDGTELIASEVVFSSKDRKYTAIRLRGGDSENGKTA